MYISAILLVCNQSYGIKYVLKKEFRWVIVVKKEKDAMDNNNEICAYSNMSKKIA